MQPAASKPEDDLHQAFNEGHTQNFGHIPFGDLVFNEKFSGRFVWPSYKRDI